MDEPNIELEALIAPYKQDKASAAAIKDGLDVWDAGEDTDPIPPRGWLLGNSFCRRFISSLVAGGGTGKTALRIAQALALATGRPITGEHVFRRSRVLIIGLEDDRDELRRRVRAAMQHHNIAMEDVRGWLFLAARRPGGSLKLATLEDGKVKAGDLGPAIREMIKQRDLDVVVIDPLVKAHAVEESANAQIDYVAGILAQIASDCDCAIDAPHHVAKGASDPGNADRGRGASAFKDAARLVYTLSTMTPDEAKTFGIPEGQRRLYVRMDSAKVNICPPAATAKWFKLVGVGLENGDDLYPRGDEAQTIEPWTPPATWEGIGNVLANEILTAIDRGLPDGSRYSDRGAAQDRAAWRAVQEHAPEKTEEQAREIIRTWVKNGALVVEDYQNPVSRHMAKGLKVNDAKRPSGPV